MPISNVWPVFKKEAFSQWEVSLKFIRRPVRNESVHR